ncbi:MAG TPA: AIR synthase-related protein [Prochlorococcaceae cyanobacterium AMR_MDS_5431]|nr:AIR synthase-related protein [Prochlorococcaceae cyanobacterium AMR_MDS_5431]
MDGLGNKLTLMAMNLEVFKQHLVLAGGGHSHILLLRYWAMNPRKRPSGLITLISPHSKSIYSGMLPGLIANFYTRQECEINLRRLCRLACVVFIKGEIVQINPEQRELKLIRDNSLQHSIRWDVLSLDVGAGGTGTGLTTVPKTLNGGRINQNFDCIDNTLCISIKPLETFLDWLENVPPKNHVIVIGGGAAGIEVAFSLKTRWPTSSVQVQVLPFSGTYPRPVFKPRINLGSIIANKLTFERLRKYNVKVSYVQVSREVDPTDSITITCTGNRVPEWLSSSNLPTDNRGRVITNKDLTVIGYLNIFATGDCGIVAQAPRPPAGVWAVRASSTLISNINRMISNDTRDKWQSGNHALQLLGDSRNSALAVLGPFVCNYNNILWRWKSKIDMRFISLFTNLKPMISAMRSIDRPPYKGKVNDSMACHGCAAKLAAVPLETALRRLHNKEKTTSQGINVNFEDAHSIVSITQDSGWLQSIDGFPALVSDPWLNGRITTLHACSDLWACGADIRSVQVFIIIPQTSESLQEEILVNTLEGVRSVLIPTNTKLIGGHTIEAREQFRSNHRLEKSHFTPMSESVQLALTINGQYPKNCFWPKGNLQEGDILILSRPIGTGILFAAEMVNAAKPEWIDTVLEEIQESQSKIIEILAHYSVNAATDITGFGLLGHLGEMLKVTNTRASSSGSSRLTAVLDPLSIRTFTGVFELIKSGFTSSLAISNRLTWDLLDKSLIKINSSNDISLDILLEILIDPQTCGPLLIGLPNEQGNAALTDLHENGFIHASIIGYIETENKVYEEV